jgi:hypothetical protein
MNDEIRILKKGSCSSITGKSKLTYQVGTDEDAALYVRITGNTGAGFFSDEWVPVKAIEEALSKDPENVTSLLLFKLFKGKSVNTPAFLLAALRNEGVVEPLKGRSRKHTLVDIGRLNANPSTPKKKVAAKKKAPAARSSKAKS